MSGRSSVVHIITGARPNYMKMLPIWLALKAIPRITVLWIHTGQHASRELAGQFFDDLFAARPDYDLEAKSADVFSTRSLIETRYTKLMDIQGVPDWVFIPGDVVSSVATWYAAKLRNANVCHVEAGLRSEVRSIEEIHRRIIDTDCELYLTHSDSATKNLLAEGRDRDRILSVGNFMIDTLRLLEPKIRSSNIGKRLGVSGFSYVVFTLHHLVNLSNLQRLREITSQLSKLAQSSKVIWPVHTHARNLLHDSGVEKELTEAGVVLLPPLPYADFIRLVQDSQFVITDSDGVEEESAYLKKICFVVRQSTARPVTVHSGSARILEPSEISNAPKIFERLGDVRIREISGWDGFATQRLMRELAARNIMGLGEINDVGSRRAAARRI
jgi:UDP-N-acetylglucosamine 2-epimerase (non-hydrolysing)